MDSCADIWTAIARLTFDSFDKLESCPNDVGVYAFAWVAALSFALVTIVDLIIFLLKRFGVGTAVSRAGFLETDTLRMTLGKAALAVFLGTIAAWIVAFLAAIVEFLKIAPQTAVATDALWQVAYAQLLTRLGKETEARAAAQTPAAPREQKPAAEVEE